MLGVMLLILDKELWSARGEDDFFSVARTIPFVAIHGQRQFVLECLVRREPLMPRAVIPWLTALRAYSVGTR